ncbi:MAG: radical SAM protein [bacterium]|nr:MAG: radical SAM protein [bacterium]
MVAGEQRCRLCGGTQRYLSASLGLCVACARSGSRESRAWIRKVHAASRREFDLPGKPPCTHGGLACVLCSNGCVLDEGQVGFCGLRTVRDGTLVHHAGTAARGLLQWYRDPLPTNCVAGWVCEGGRRAGDHNLAVFYESCSANCLFCQNWHFRRISPRSHDPTSADELASGVNEHTFCICFFGGDPSTQMPHALAVSRRLARRGTRICWETNGMMHPALLDAALRYSLRTGGCIKFDLKAFNEDLHIALTGVSNRRTLENFERAAGRAGERHNPPLVVASTLLVPGYVEPDEVQAIARFIASIDPQIPYALLGFAPQWYMHDLPCTSRQHAMEAEEAAREAGLVDVRIGNRHLLDLP